MPLRQAVQRFGFTALILASLILLVISRAGLPVIEQARTLVADVVAPVLRAMAQPVVAANDVIRTARQAVEIYRENDRLRTQNAVLLQWQDVARRLDAENQSLRKLSNFTPTDARWSLTAQVIGAAGGAYSRTVLVDRGSADGVAKGQAALGPSGLIGRVVEVGSHSARILMLTDINSRIPVTLERTRERAILFGDNGEQPRLAYLAASARPQPGDRLVTAGDGGIFPPNLPVGVVSEIAPQIRVEPLTELSTLDFVRIMDFGLSGVLSEAAVPQPKPAVHKGTRDNASRDNPPH